MNFTDVDSLRGVLAQLVTDALPSFPVSKWLPEDMEELPCAVVGRPLLTPDPDVGTAVMASTTVTVVGRRLTADDAQQELDQAAWSVMGAYNGFRGMQVNGSVHRLVLVSMEPDLVAVGGDEYPCYRLNTEAHMVDC